MIAAVIECREESYGVRQIRTLQEILNNPHSSPEGRREAAEQCIRVMQALDNRQWMLGGSPLQLL